MTDDARFWTKVDRDGPVPQHRPQLGPCWLWQGAVKGDGYAQVTRTGTWPYVHRLAYELTVGPIPTGLQLDHLCRVRHCVNPDHLEAVTPAENSRRAIGVAPELNRAKTHCKRGHLFDEANTYHRSDGRECRTCAALHRERSLARQAVLT